MESGKNSKNNSRRDFIKTIAVVSPAFLLGFQKLSAMNSLNPEGTIEFKYRTFSVEHIKEVKEWMDKLRNENKISDDKTYRSYIDGFVYNPEEILPGAKSVIILARPQNMTSLILNYNAKKYEIIIPTGYTSDGVKSADIKNQVMKDIIKDDTKKLEPKVKLPLKTIAAKSGLSQYGKNNIAFVDGYGSYHELRGYYTDQVLDDQWGQMKMLRECNGCSICIKQCPTKCIRDNNFVIDAGKCLSLFSELEDKFPDWIDPKFHNALIGCLKCQFECPANAAGLKKIVKMPELTHEETEFILKNTKDEQLKKSVEDKLSSRFPGIKYTDYISRNLNMVFNNTNPM